VYEKILILCYIFTILKPIISTQELDSTNISLGKDIFSSSLLFCSNNISIVASTVFRPNVTD